MNLTSSTRHRGGLLLALLLAACSTSERPPRSESELSGWAGPPAGAKDPEQIRQGLRIAERRCASCHAIDRTSSSLEPGAPPLRDVLVLNDSDRIAYRLIDSVRLGHDKMPLFDFDVTAADALIAYLESIAGP